MGSGLTGEPLTASGATDNAAESKVERSNAMIDHQINDVIFRDKVSDETVEATAFVALVRRCAAKLPARPRRGS